LQTAEVVAERYGIKSRTPVSDMPCVAKIAPRQLLRNAGYFLMAEIVEVNDQHGCARTRHQEISHVEVTISQE